MTNDEINKIVDKFRYVNYPDVGWILGIGWCGPGWEEVEAFESNLREVACMNIGA